MGANYSALHDKEIHQQNGGTCWANAAAQAIISTQKRIIGRSVEKHEALTKYLIKKYPNPDPNKSGRNAYKVLEIECKNRYLGCKKVNVNGAINALKKKRVVVGLFRLSQQDWKIFGTFVKEHAKLGNKALLTKDVFNNPHKYLQDCKYTRYSSSKDGGGHAVAIVEYEDGIYNNEKQCDTYWKIKNSWGAQWGDNGYFYMSEDALPRGITYIDVFFRINDLPPWERIQGISHLPNVIQKEIETTLDKISEFDHNAWKLTGTPVDSELRQSLREVTINLLNLCHSVEVDIQALQKRLKKIETIMGNDYTKIYI